MEGSASVIRWIRRLATGRWRRVPVAIVAVVLVSVEAPLAASVNSILVGPALALSLAHAGSLLVALWRPRSAAVLSVAASLALTVASVPRGLGPWPWGVTSLITQVLVIVLVCLVGGWRTALACLIASVALPGVVVVALMHWRGLAGPTSDLLVFASIAATALVLTAALQSRVFVAAALVREQRASAEEAARRRLVEEKARIARELHDVIAHNMSLISVQARSAAYRLEGLPASATAEFDEIADRAKDALMQMRGVLAVLRTPDEDAARAPQPGIAQVPALVASVRAAGLVVALDWELPEGTQVAPLTGLSVHRIVQEALSNVMRHAPDAPVSVRVGISGDELVTTVENPLTGPTGAMTGGHGVVGMRERAAAAGGTLVCGPTPRGCFQVVARLPVQLAVAGRHAL